MCFAKTLITAFYHSSGKNANCNPRLELRGKGEGQRETEGQRRTAREKREQWSSTKRGREREVREREMDSRWAEKE